MVLRPRIARRSGVRSGLRRACHPTRSRSQRSCRRARILSSPSTNTSVKYTRHALVHILQFEDRLWPRRIKYCIPVYLLWEWHTVLTGLSCRERKPTPNRRRSRRRRRTTRRTGRRIPARRNRRRSSRILIIGRSRSRRRSRRGSRARLRRRGRARQREQRIGLSSRNRTSLRLRHKWHQSQRRIRQRASHRPAARSQADTRAGDAATQAGRQQLPPRRRHQPATRATRRSSLPVPTFESRTELTHDAL